MLKGDEEGCAGKVCDPDGEVEGPLDGCDEGTEECALLKASLLRATNKRTRPKQISVPDGEVEGTLGSSYGNSKEGALLELNLLEGDEEG